MNTGVLIIDLEGIHLTVEEQELLQNPAVAGALLFSRNFQSRNQLVALVKDIRSIRSDLLLTVDQEGGRVQRFKEDFIRLPAAAKYGAQYKEDQKSAVTLTRDAGWLMASELLSCGIDLCIGPVLDIDIGKTAIVGDRAFGQSAEQVIALAKAWVAGMHEAGMSAVIKHFPGHGNVDDDSHLSLPVDGRPFDEIEQHDMQPFKALIEYGVEAVMPAHIVFPEVDDFPAGFSRVWQEDILRDRLGFGGLTISDCLTMEGAASGGSYVERTEKALSAGCDLLILSNRDGVKEVLEHSKSQSIRGVGPSRLLSMNRPDWNVLHSSMRFLHVRDILQALS